jgi:hypothetical protein
VPLTRRCADSPDLGRVQAACGALVLKARTRVKTPQHGSGGAVESSPAGALSEPFVPLAFVGRSMPHHPPSRLRLPGACGHPARGSTHPPCARRRREGPGFAGS